MSFLASQVLTEDSRTLTWAACTWHYALGILIVKYPRRGRDPLYKRLVYATDFRTYNTDTYVELMIHIITEAPVYIRMVDVQIFNSAPVFTQTRCIVGITLCGCVWLFDKTIPPVNFLFVQFANCPKITSMKSRHVSRISWGRMRRKREYKDSSYSYIISFPFSKLIALNVFVRMTRYIPHTSRS